MPAKSEKQANLFRAALGDPAPGTGAAKIKASVPREKIKHFAQGGEVEEGTLETLGLTESKLRKLRKILSPIIQEVMKESRFSK